MATSYYSIFLISGIASVVLAVFSLSLPHTPAKPAAAGEGGFAWVKAAKFLSKLTVDGVVNYKELFLWPTGLSLAAAVLLLVAFYPPKELDAPSEVSH